MTIDDHDKSPYLTVEQAATRLQLKPSTLVKWRHLGQGPIFRTHGSRIVYHINELDEWSDGQKQQKATPHKKPFLIDGEGE